jgi:pyruvate/2-oxoglutarate dehydrogenase complex dihydrolipoamide acyltransferase (E2) component
MIEAVLTEWLVPDGSVVREGDVIYAIESEKAVQDIESPAAGTLRIIAEPGVTYPVGAVVAEIS